MTTDDMDCWFVHTNAYIEAIEEPPAEAPRPERRWPLLVAASLAFGIATYVLTAYVL